MYTEEVANFKMTPDSDRRVRQCLKTWEKENYVGVRVVYKIILREARSIISGS